MPVRLMVLLLVIVILVAMVSISINGRSRGRMMRMRRIVLMVRTTRVPVQGSDIRDLATDDGCGSLEYL